MTSAQREKIHRAIREWMVQLNSYPGWSEWNQKKIRFVMYYEDAVSVELEPEFQFSIDIEKQHSIIMSYLSLEKSIEDLKNVEFYFRRYPFNGLPITKYSHLANVCEMYFSKFYEFSERAKEHFDKIKSHNQEPDKIYGKIISKFKKEFAFELKERNLSHHHRKFSDIAIEQLFMIDILGKSASTEDAKWLLDTRYRRIKKEWIVRLRRKSTRAELYLDDIADITLKKCNFLGATADTIAGNVRPTSEYEI